MAHCPERLTNTARDFLEANWDEYEDEVVLPQVGPIRIRKRTYVRKRTSNVRNHFLRPIYKRPEILSNRIISEPNLWTFGLIRRKVAFFCCSCPHGGRGKYFGGFDSCPRGGRGKYFGRSFSCPHGGRGKYFRGFFSCPHGGSGKYFGG